MLVYQSKVKERLIQKSSATKIKPQIKIGLIDMEVPEPTTCSHMAGNTDGAIRLRCRAPCLIGFDACPRHVNSPATKSTTSYKLVDRVIDVVGVSYFIDENSIAIDKNGKTRGYVEDNTLILFEKT